MGYFKGLFTSLGIALPSYLFIHIYLQEIWVPNFFTDLVGGNWGSLLEVCETTIMEPITVFFVAPQALRILFAFVPWVIIAFITSFFFRKKHAARLGFATTITLFFIAEIVYYLVIQQTILDVDTLTQPNPLYGYLVIQGTVAIVGLLAGLISPFKKEASLDYTPPPASQRRRPARPADPTPTVSHEPVNFDSPVFMPTESPSRDEYVERNHAPTSQRTPSAPAPCEYCGSFLDPDSEFCSVCGNRVNSDY
ncbi:MAG: hypothetical protein ACTSQ0_02775 [Candidatus Heimdallarchaeota archaeon]